MQETDELLVELMTGKGRKAPKNHYKFAASKSRRASTEASLKNKINSRTSSDLLLTASKMPQAILKISGYCKGTKHAQKHINYITRYGNLELIVSDGSSIKGTTAIKELMDSWSADFGNRKNSRDVLKLVLSAPENSDPNKLKVAAAKFLINEFGNSNDYAYVLHTDTKKPHVHAVIQMVAYNGKKLDPRKYYIEQIRRDFAKFCREEGIIVEASRRYQRGLNGKSKNTPVNQMRKNKYQDIKIDKKFNLAVVSYQEKNKNYLNVVPNRNKIVRAEYLKAAVELHELSNKSNDKIIQNKYQKAAGVLLKFAKNMPTEQRFITRIIDKISNRKGQSTDQEPINFKAYIEVLATLDTYKKSVIPKIEHQNSNSNKHKRHNIESEADLDI